MNEYEIDDDLSTSSEVNRESINGHLSGKSERIYKDNTELMSSTKIFKPILGEWKIEVNGENHIIGTIVIKTYPIMGLTFFNMLRRVGLGLSSSYGVSGFKFNIKNHGKEIEPLHEYDSVSGVVEDVPYFSYNIKGLIIRVTSLVEGDLTPVQYFILKFKSDKAGPVYGHHIDTESFNKNNTHIKVEVVNKNHILCHLDLNTVIEGEIFIRLGFGYASEEDQERFLHKICGTNKGKFFFVNQQFSKGVLSINGNVTEVTGGSVPYDALELKIVTDGRMEPEDVMREAFFILHSQIPYSFENKNAMANTSHNANSNDQILEVSLDGIFGSSIVQLLSKHGILSLGDLTSKTEKDLQAIKGCGHVKVEHIKYVLLQLGLALK